MRSTALDAAIEALGGVTIAHGDFSDLEAIEKLSSNHNIVLNCATSTNAPVTAAILRGIRNTKTPKKPILHHLSGAGNFVDGSTSGTYVPQPRPWNDGNPDDVRNITAALTPNGACDELILKAAAAEGYVDAFFVCPGGIYGASANHIGVAAGAAAALAPGVWVGWMMDSIATLGFSPYVGDGTAVFRTVHVDDVHPSRLWSWCSRRRSIRGIPAGRKTCMAISTSVWTRRWRRRMWLRRLLM